MRKLSGAIYLVSRLSIWRTRNIQRSEKVGCWKDCTSAVLLERLHFCRVEFKFSGLLHQVKLYNSHDNMWPNTTKWVTLHIFLNSFSTGVVYLFTPSWNLFRVLQRSTLHVERNAICSL
jgi:hypothetical protein